MLEIYIILPLAKFYELSYLYKTTAIEKLGKNQIPRGVTNGIRKNELKLF